MDVQALHADFLSVRGRGTASRGAAGGAAAAIFHEIADQRVQETGVIGTRTRRLLASRTAGADEQPPASVVVSAARPGAGGEGGIRTHGGREPTAVFKTAALNHSATSPCRRDLGAARRRLNSRGRR